MFTNVSVQCVLCHICLLMYDMFNMIRKLMKLSENNVKMFSFWTTNMINNFFDKSKGLCQLLVPVLLAWWNSKCLPITILDNSAIFRVWNKRTAILYGKFYGSKDLVHKCFNFFPAFHTFNVETNIKHHFVCHDNNSLWVTDGYHR